MILIWPICLTSAMVILAVWLGWESPRQPLVVGIVVLLVAGFWGAALAASGAIELVVEDGTISWRGLVRRGRLPVADITEIAWADGWFMQRLVFRGADLYASATMPGIRHVVQRIHELNPNVTMSLSELERRGLS